MTAPNDINSWWGRDVADRHGDKIGTVDEVYLDPTTGEPKWVSIKSGLLGTRSSLAPLSGASVTSTHITVGFDKEAVRNVPDVVTDDELTPQDEDRLHHYYRLDHPASTPQGPASGPPSPATPSHQEEPATPPRPTGEPAAPGPQHGGRGGALGAAFGEAARTIGQAASREVRDARERVAQRRERDRSGAETAAEHRTGPRPDATPGDLPSAVTRIRRHVVTEHLSATGEVLRRETHTEEVAPDVR